MCAGKGFSQKAFFAGRRYMSEGVISYEGVKALSRLHMKAFDNN